MVRADLFSAVGQHPLDAFLIGVAKNRALAQASATLGRFVREQVRSTGLAPLELSALGRFEALGGAFPCLQFWHGGTPRSLEQGRRELRTAYVRNCDRGLPDR